MVKRRRKGSDEILLVPFLDILCSLIGVLILIIVVLCVSQSQQTQGRTAEEVRMAQEHKDMLKQLEERKKLEQLLAEKIESLKGAHAALQERQDRYLKLRKLLDSSKELQEENKAIGVKLQKELDDLLTEIDGIKRQQTSTKEEIAALQAEIKKRQVDPDKKVPPVVVQPSGSGMSESTKVFFVECSKGSLKVIGGWGNEDYRLASTASVVVADQTFKHFLREVAKNKDSLVLFLVRDDGQEAYQNGAGYAESGFEIRTGKLPIPGRGVLDLSTFEKYRGKVAPPPPSSTELPPASSPAPQNKA